MIVAMLFIGIILSFTAYFGITAAFDDPDSAADACWDGEQHEEITLKGFSDAFYRSKELQNTIKEYEFRLFGTVANDNIISGHDDFLFEKSDSTYDYNYLADCTGNYSFSEEELQQIADNIRQRQRRYALDSTYYMLVVIPNSQTIYSEKLPFYISNDRADTRLEQLSAYISQNYPSVSFLNLTESLLAAKSESEYPLYNNTDNSLNALGEWYVYSAIYDALGNMYDIVSESGEYISLTSKNPKLELDDLSFYVHNSEGKRLAREAGLAQIISNRTVSLSNDLTTNKYSIFAGYNGSPEETIHRDRNRFQSSKPFILFSFSSEWDKILIQPYMSNTFFRVGYGFNMSYNNEAYTAVVQIIHENELSSLLNPDVALTYDISSAAVQTD